MRIVAQRVSQASVSVSGKTLAAIGPGLLVLAGVGLQDGEEDAAWMAGKLARLRVFPDGEGKMNLSVADTRGEVLLISQFTLLAATAKGNRPSFTPAAPPEKALPLFQSLVKALEKELGKPVPTGEFGA